MHFMPTRFSKYALGFLGGLTLLNACDNAPPPEQITESGTIAEESIAPEIVEQASSAIWLRGENAIAELQTSVTSLQSEVERFLSEPSEEQRKQVKTAWQKAVTDYRAFTFARTLSLVEPDKFSQLNRLDFQISAYPIQAGFLDSFGSFLYSGLVNDIGFPLSKESLINQHGITDVEDAALGLYAIEFVIFGHHEPRPIEDYNALTSLSVAHKENGYKKIEELPNNRRRELLALQVAVLVEDTRALSASWNSDSKAVTKSHWDALTAEQKTILASATLAHSLTQILLEIGEANNLKKKEVSRVLPPSIQNATTEVQAVYIQRALSSLEDATAFIPASKRAAASQYLSAAIDTLDKLSHLSTDSAETNNEEKNKDSKPLWMQSYENVKAFIDLL